MRGNIFSLIVFVFICLAAAGIGSFFTAKSVSSWYITLSKPVWNPPNWVFGPVWTFIYLTIAVSGWLTWRQVSIFDNPVIYIIFGLQLILNMAWSGIFFALQQPGWAFVDIIFLWLLIISYIVFDWPVSKWASILFIPYFLWVGFAAILNFSIWQLN